jgi:hypothetical protein
MANSYQVKLPGGAYVNVQAFSNASFTQAVTIQPPSGSGANAVFTGNGENNTTQALKTPGFLKPNGSAWPSFTVPGGSGTNQTYTVSVTANGTPSNVVGQVLTLQPSGNIILGFVSSEDSTDKDYNDSVVLFTAYIPA